MLQGDRIKVSNRDGRKKTGSKVGIVIHVDKYSSRINMVKALIEKLLI